MILSAVVAIAENNAIGKNNELLWHLPNDLKHFKQITTGHTVIMGRKTEIYKLAFPLLNRVYLTVVHHDFDGDAYFPELDKTRWIETAREEHEIDEKHAIPYTFITLERQ